MSRMPARAVLLGAGAAVASLPAPAAAAPWEFSGRVHGEAGYSQNPYLTAGTGRGSISLSGGIEGQLTQREETGATTLSGFYARQFFINSFEDTDSFGGAIDRQQQFSERLSGSARVGYSSSRNVFTDTVDVIDQVSIGARRKAIDGTASLSWVPSARDSFSVSGFGSHASYGGFGLSDYDSYGATFAYNRTLNEKTTVGLSGTVSHTHSKFFGDTDTVQPNVTAKHKLNSFWTLDGSLGLIFQKTDFGGGSGKSKSVGFDVSLCGKYPRWDLCAQASRSTAASGFGGLRTETTAALRYNYTLDERSRINVNGVVGKSKSVDRALFAPEQTYASIDAGYSRDISRRLSTGVSAGYRYRKFDTAGDAHGFTATINLSAKIGRLR